jgi:hypothetical protein
MNPNFSLYQRHVSVTATGSHGGRPALRVRSMVVPHAPAARVPVRRQVATRDGGEHFGVQGVR